MKEALADHPVNDFHMPDEITFAHINPATGKRATATSSRAILEIFARGTEPQLPQPAPDVAIADANSPSPIGTEAPRPIREPAVVVAPSNTPEARTPLDELVDRQIPAAQQAEPLTEELLDPDIIPAPDDTVDTTETTDTIVPEANADVGTSVVDPSPTEHLNDSAEPLQEEN
jgi:hypothetical protein